MQVRNWLYFTWLSGDHIVEQHVHNIDVMNWCFGGHPVSAYGMGGRQVRTDPLYGNIFDHFAIEYTYPNGAKITSMCRQIDGCDSRVAERVVGSKGVSNPANTIYDLKGTKTWGYKNVKGALGPYQQEHVDLINSHPRRRAAQRSRAHRREHAHRHHGPHERVHRQGSHVGAGEEFQAQPLAR